MTLGAQRNKRMEDARRLVLRHFPDGTETTMPRGGYFLWVQMPEEVNALEVYENAMQRGIGVAPGMVFTLTDGFSNCLRLNCSFPVGGVEEAIVALGSLAGEAQARVRLRPAKGKRLTAAV